MAITCTTSTPGKGRVLALLAGAALLALASLVLITLASGTAEAQAASHTATSGSYAWPVKPFNRAHPVRANFGDPRTTFHGSPTQAGIMTSGGSFSFHFGIDIAVPDGTPVYPVHSGTATLVGAGNVQVTSGSQTTQYWHLVTAVRPGQRVTAYETVLGRVMKGYEHVHFTELDGGRPVNPLAPGHLAPYAETAAPQVAEISFRVGNSAREILPEAVSGAVVPVVRAFDKPALPVPGIWRNLPVAPALLSWHVERVTDSRIVIRERVAFDVRLRIPENGSFWSVYARGSRQNMATFGKQRAWRMPGTYLYRLSPRPIDTRALPNGIYCLVVTAADMRGNRSSSEQIFIVRNGRAT